MEVLRKLYTALVVGLLLDLVPRALALGSDNSKMGMNDAPDQPGTLHPAILPSNSTFMEVQSYFRHPEHSALILAHITFMGVCWVFILPLGVMLSIARSRLSAPIQILFLVLNGFGVLLAIIHNSITPDLYANSAHRPVGWILTWIVGAQVVMAAFIRACGRKNNATDTGNPNEQLAFIPISAEAIEEHERIHLTEQNYRFSNDSGHGTERNTESLRSHSISSIDGLEEDRVSSMGKYENKIVDGEKRTLRLVTALYKLISIPASLSSRTLQAMILVQEIINRLILVLGYIALTTGIVTYFGIFRGYEVFSGLAHFIKGGVFFWYGILTLGRWAGSFASLGWAWNIRPPKRVVGRHKTFTPSAEFVESFLIFFYGSTNIFLEHLGAWGQAWSAQDLEHISITVMFIGGGLCGMLIESNKIRELLSIQIQQSSLKDHNLNVHDRDGQWKLPKSYLVSMNPLPAMIVFLLGLMMSSHHQASMVSTMVHKQWGILLACAALARITTYIIFYLSPPTSHFPSRPPSELITTFCLMAGGIIFMGSSHDIIKAIESNNLNAMFIFTVTMGLTSFLMAWIIIVIAIKGWAIRRNAGIVFKTLPII